MKEVQSRTCVFCFRNASRPLLHRNAAKRPITCRFANIQEAKKLLTAFNTMSAQNLEQTNAVSAVGLTLITLVIRSV